MKNNETAKGKATQQTEEDRLLIKKKQLHFKAEKQRAALADKDILTIPVSVRMPGSAARPRTDSHRDRDPEDPIQYFDFDPTDAILVTDPDPNDRAQRPW